LPQVHVHAVLLLLSFNAAFRKFASFLRIPRAQLLNCLAKRL